jgi:hypothetical protein
MFNCYLGGALFPASMHWEQYGKGRSGIGRAGPVLRERSLPSRSRRGSPRRSCRDNRRRVGATSVLPSVRIVEPPRQPFWPWICKTYIGPGIEDREVVLVRCGSPRCEYLLDTLMRRSATARAHGGTIGGRAVQTERRLWIRKMPGGWGKGGPAKGLSVTRARAWRACQ